MNNKNWIATSITGAMVILAGCGTGRAPQELVDARAAYHEAQTGAAAQYKPDLVYEAKVALEKAEAAYAEDEDGEDVRDLAYVAHRKAQLAEAEAGAAAAAAREESAKNEAQQVQGQMLSQTQQELNATKAKSATELAAEKQKRMEAEQRAQAAMQRMAAMSALAYKEEPRGTVITLPGNVFFASGKSELLPAAQDRLKNVGDALKEQGDSTILIEGHTDSKGTESSNMALSQRRAEAVRAYFVSQGLNGDNIKAVGVGPSRPAADNKTAEGRASNRRVEIIIQDVEKR